MPLSPLLNLCTSFLSQILLNETLPKVVEAPIYYHSWDFYSDQLNSYLWNIKPGKSEVVSNIIQDIEQKVVQALNFLDDPQSNSDDTLTKKKKMETKSVFRSLHFILGKIYFHVNTNTHFRSMYSAGKKDSEIPTLQTALDHLTKVSTFFTVYNYILGMHLCNSTTSRSVSTHTTNSTTR